MEKLMMNKLEDMELDMVSGGVPGLPPPCLSKRKRVRRRKRYLKTFIDNCAEGVDNLLVKVFGPQRKR